MVSATASSAFFQSLSSPPQRSTSCHIFPFPLPPFIEVSHLLILSDYPTPPVLISFHIVPDGFATRHRIAQDYGGAATTLEHRGQKNVRPNIDRFTSSSQPFNIIHHKLIISALPPSSPPSRRSSRATQFDARQEFWSARPEPEIRSPFSSPFSPLAARIVFARHQVTSRLLHERHSNEVTAPARFPFENP
ncbi:hypothetical protein FDECE_12431 [Fusarium decemcellulare]|nr:hypothetical protein FDECE_12431 [Fusarium decemcellulare]